MQPLDVQPLEDAGDEGESGVRLRGAAQGQERYALWATLDAGQVTAAHCACPVGGGGRCKHVGALLARAVQDRAAFHELPALRGVLEELNVSELRALIERMVEVEPPLQALVLASATRPPAPGGSSGGPSGGTVTTLPAGLRAARQSVEAAFAGLAQNFDPFEDQEEGPDDSGIRAAMESADALLEGTEPPSAEQAAWALTVYLAVLDGVDEAYSDLDIDWGLDDVRAHALSGVQALMAAGTLPEDERAEAIEAVQDAVVEGYGLYELDGLADFAEALGEEEYRAFLALLEGLMEKDARPQRLARALHRVTFFDELSDEAREALLRKADDLPQLLDFLLERGRSADALAAVNEQPPRDLAALAPTFALHAQLPLLEELARTQLTLPGARAWLFGRYADSGADNGADSGRRAEAHRLALEAVQARPTLEWIAALKRVSPAWPRERAALIERLWTSGSETATLMALLLSEGLSEEALRLSRERADIRGDQLLGLAEALGGAGQLQQAAELLERAARLGIERKSQRGYAEATAILGRLPALLGEDAARTRVRALAQQYPRLSSLKRELEGARLL